MGYAGGTKENPTYHQLGDHTEMIQIDYDPTQIAYQDLLGIFWGEHEPECKAWSRQYMSMILYHNDEQRRIAAAVKEREENKKRVVFYTEINPYHRFYLAEGYHQKYYLQLVSEIEKDFRSIYPHIKDFVNSTAAARINGYIKGCGSMAGLKKELEQLGLSERSGKRLLEIVQGYGR